MECIDADVDMEYMLRMEEEMMREADLERFQQEAMWAFDHRVVGDTLCPFFEEAEGGGVIAPAFTTDDADNPDTPADSFGSASSSSGPPPQTLCNAVMCTLRSLQQDGAPITPSARTNLPKRMRSKTPGKRKRDSSLNVAAELPRAVCLPISDGSTCVVPGTPSASLSPPPCAGDAPSPQRRRIIGKICVSSCSSAGPVQETVTSNSADDIDRHVNMTELAVAHGVMRLLADRDAVQSQRQHDALEAVRANAVSQLALSQRCFRVVKEVEMWDSEYDALRARYKFCVLDGLSMMGKTAFARSKCPAGMEVFEINCAAGGEFDLRPYKYGKHGLVLCNDIEAEAVAAQRKLFQAGTSLVQLGTSPTNVHVYSVYVHRVRIICASNNWMESLGRLTPADRAWIEDNSVYVHVDRPLWDIE